jgi:predicted metal-dependent hydrolase
LVKRKSVPPAGRTVHVDGIGPVRLERSARARRIIISVRPRRGVRVAVPVRASFKQALEFLELKKAWVRQHLVRLEREEARRQILADSLAGIDRAAAATRLKERLRQLAARYRFEYNRVFIRNQRTRWGSCSHHNNISLNTKLVMLPPELMDYVILHELVHTRVHDHSRRFWAELDRYVGDARALSRRVRRSGMDLL